MAITLSNQGGIFGPNVNAAGIFGGLPGGFTSPWLDVATLAMPQQNKNALAWCQYLWQQQGTYRSAQERRISYFITDLDVGSVDPDNPIGDDEKEKWLAFSEEPLELIGVIRSMLINRECYGNSFASMMVPFKRLLVCPKCGLHVPFEEVERNPRYRFSWDNFEFVLTCPSRQCGNYRGPWLVNDEPDDLVTKLKVKIWPPDEIEIIHDIYTDDVAYVWQIPEDYKKEIRQGNPFVLARAGKEVIKAVKHNCLYLFHPDVIYHMKEPTLAGIRNRGWGISRILTLFRDLFHVQVLRRYNESIALDYIIPFRLITPEPRSGGGGSALAEGSMTDPLHTINMGDFRSQVMRMIRRRRQDPAGWNFLPFPVRYQALGGDAKNLAPVELLDQAQETLLNGGGIPMDMYRGSLQVQAAPVALRLFEANNRHLVLDIDGFLRWVSRQVAQLLSWESVRLRMRRVTHADDLNKQMAKLQLMMGQAISQTTGLRAIGLDWDDEQRQIAEEARRQAQLQAQVQEEMEQAAFGEQIAKGQPTAPGGMPPGAAPGAAPQGGAPADPSMAGPVTGMLMSGNTPQTPNDMLAQAESLATQLLALPESQKDSELRALAQKNEFLHALVKAQMEKKRNRARTAGGAMLLGQQGAVPMG